MSSHLKSRSGRPPRYGGPAGPIPLILAMAAGPTGWIVQLVLDYGLSSAACYPNDAPLRQSPPPGWDGEHLLLLGINLACLLLPVLGAALGISAWRRSHREQAGGAETLLEVGEGRTRFLASCAVMASLGFGLAILFNTASTIGAPACWSILG